MPGFRTLDDVDVRDKRVLLRLDLNVPMEDGKVTDATRIERAKPTIIELSDTGAKVILLSHFGRPKGRDPKESLKPVAEAAAKIIGRPIAFADDCVGEAAESAVAKLKPGDILCLENTRFHAGEEKNDPAFVSALARLGDIWVNDAFSAAHRAHASTEGLGHKLPAYAGRSMQAELEALSRALDAPERPVAAIVGGAKVSTKLDLLGNLVGKVNVLMIGGAMANTFLAALGKPIGKSLAERDMLDTAREILAKAKAKGCEVVLPVDAVVAGGLDSPSGRAVSVRDIPAEQMGLDLGPLSVERFATVLKSAKTIVWNGPMGVFEKPAFATGTVALARAVAESAAFSVIGGGDTVAAVNQAGVAHRIGYISTAGGAFLEFLEGRALPGVEALTEA